MVSLESNKPYGVTRHSTEEYIDLWEFGVIANNPSLLLYGQYFGLWNITIFNEENDYFKKIYFSADTIALTTFGKFFITFLVKNAPFTLWNEPHRKSEGDRSPLGVPFDEKIYDYLEEGKSTKSLIKKMKAKYKPFFTIMQPFFAEPIQSDFELKPEKTITKGNFILEVEMEHFTPKITRTIQLGNQSTLENLHDAIINSVDFDDDHLYEFYMDKNKRQGYSRFYEYSDPPFASDFMLSDFDLHINKRFGYTFDFGENWNFVITVKDFEETDKPLKKAKLIGKKGESPEQYPSWDDEEEY